MRHIVTQNNSRGGSVKSNVGTATAEPNGSKRKLRETKTKREAEKKRKEESLINNVLDKIS